MTGFGWDRRIERAEELAAETAAAAEILRFYAAIARFQRDIYETLLSGPPLPQVFALESHVPSLLSLVERVGPDPLSHAARELAQHAKPWEMLIAGLGHTEVKKDFFARCLLQPYYEFLAGRSNLQQDSTPPVCPVCGHKPVVAVLRGEGDGGKRSLICSLCSAEWNFRRLLCPLCGEENERKLPIYVAQEFSHVRVEACDTCQSYVKCVDLTDCGLAVPVVDELATIGLDLWVEEHGYTKLQSNLLGM